MLRRLGLHKQKTSPEPSKDKPGGRLVISEDDVLSAVKTCMSVHNRDQRKSTGQHPGQKFAEIELDDPNVMVGASLIVFTLFTTDEVPIHHAKTAMTPTNRNHQAQLPKRNCAFSSSGCARVYQKKPSESKVYEFFCDMLEFTDYSPETTVMAVALLIRIWHRQPGALHAGNWSQVLLTAVCVSQKILDDICLENVDFVKLHNLLWHGDCVTLRDVNRWEVEFLRLLDFRVHVTQVSSKIRRG
jgi:hypothetical protein